MELREITTYHEKAPFKGYGVWIVFENKFRRAHLLHPSTLTELILSEYEFVRSSGNSLWPLNNTGTTFNIDRFKANFKERIKFFIKNKKSFPVNLVAQVISELDEISMEDTLKYLSGLMDQRREEFPSEAEEERIALEKSFDRKTRVFRVREGIDTSQVTGRSGAIIKVLKQSGPATMYEITERCSGTLRTKCKLSRAVTYLVNKLTSQGILEIVAY